jgi:hypothetical protein
LLEISIEEKTNIIYLDRYEPDDIVLSGASEGRDTFLNSRKPISPDIPGEDREEIGANFSKPSRKESI